MKTIALLSLLFAPWITLAETIEFDGVAYSDRTKQLVVYREKHVWKKKGGKLQSAETTYFDSNKNEIASLRTNYVKNVFAPDFVFVDRRIGLWEEGELESGRFKVSFKGRSDDDVQRKAFKFEQELIASQGFNQYILRNFDQLKTGGKLNPVLLLPSRMTTVRMSINAQHVNDEKLAVTIEVDNLLLRLFAPKSSLTYSKNARRLLSYFGASNLLTDSGEKQIVYIEYEYRVARAYGVKS